MQVDFNKNRKQEIFFNEAIKALYGITPNKYLFYGGGIRGGKSFVSLATLLFAAKNFPNSRWHVFRKDFPVLASTTIPSLEKIIAGDTGWGWNRDKSNFFVYNRKTDGKIFLKGENIERDPELNDLLGLETNGIMFEQIEELSRKLWDQGLSRIGSWYIEKMPKAITLSTFNPTQEWIKEFIYLPWARGELQSPYYFLEALPSDSMFVTQDQWDAWQKLDERSRRKLIEGDWTDFSAGENLWAYAFDSKKHLGRPELNRMHPVYLSFDFNKNPICCTVIQYYDNKIKVLECVKLANSDIYAICDYIRAVYKDCLFIVTGDASGKGTSALVKDNLNYYTVIRTKLGLASTQIKVPSVNPALEDNQVLVNSILANHIVEIHEEKAKALLFDLGNVKMMPDGSIDKGNRKDPTKQADALDTFRYFCNQFLPWFLKLS